MNYQNQKIRDDIKGRKSISIQLKIKNYLRPLLFF